MAYHTLSQKLYYDNSSLPDNTSYLNKHNNFKIKGYFWQGILKVNITYKYVYHANLLFIEIYKIYVFQLIRIVIT